MKKLTRRPLPLNAETLRRLSDAQLLPVDGGQKPIAPGSDECASRSHPVGC